VYQGFNFVGTPQSMLEPHDDADDKDDSVEHALESGRKVVLGFNFLGPAGLVLLIIFGAWVLIRIRG
jgi:hypothetical protein